MELILPVALLVLLDIAALKWGVDSRDAASPRDQDLPADARAARRGVLR